MEKEEAIKWLCGRILITECDGTRHVEYIPATQLDGEVQIWIINAFLHDASNPAEGAINLG